MRTGSSYTHSGGDRAAQLKSAIDQFRSRLDAGESIDDGVFCGEHVELMPELGVQIRMLRRIRSLDPSSAPVAAGEFGSVYDDQEIRRFLQENLPQYTLLDAISRGGQGVVYRAVHLHTHREVAIKVLANGVFATRQQLDRFMLEIELAARLRHSNIVSIFDSGTIQGRPYCVMEYVEGVAVWDYMLVERPSLRQRIELFIKICRAVSSAHQQGVIHRDLKPENILVDNDGEPRLLDFGLAKDAFARNASGGGLSVDGQVIGTLDYLSPEQIRGISGEIDVRTDIYALGLVFYRALTGHSPYPVAESYDAVRSNILERMPASFRGLPPSEEETIDFNRIDADVEAILRKALEKNKKDRYQSADAMADDFERFLRNELVTARADTRFYVFRKTLRRYRVQFAVAAAFFIVTTTAAILSTTLYFRAIHERDRAGNASSLALSLMNQVLTKFDQQVSFLPGGVDARNEILRVIEPLLRQLAGVVNDMDGASPQVAMLNLNLSKSNLSAGRIQEAKELCRRSIDQFAALTSPDDESRSKVIEATITLADLLDDPEDTYREAVKLAQEGVRRTGAPEFRVLLCEALSKLGTYFDRSGDRATAVEWAEQAIATFEDVDAGVGSMGGYRRMAHAAVDAHIACIHAYQRIGGCDQLLGHLQDAEKLLNRTLGKYESDVVSLRQRMQLNYLYAEFHDGNGDADAALAAVDQAIRDGEILCCLAPNDFFLMQKLCYARLRRTQIVRWGDPDAALEDACRIEEAVSEWQVRFPNEPRLHEIRAYISKARFLAVSNKHDWEQCSAYIDATLREFEMMKSAGVTFVSAREMIALALDWDSKVNLNDKNWDEAINFAAASMDLRQQLLAECPNSLDMRLEYIIARYDFWNAIARSGNLDDMLCAEQIFREIIDEANAYGEDSANDCFHSRIAEIVNGAQKGLRRVRESITQLENELAGSTSGQGSEAVASEAVDFP